MILPERQKQQLVEHASRMPIQQIIDLIQQYENITLADFSTLSNERKERIERILGPVHYQEWIPIQSGSPSLDKLKKIICYVLKWRESLTEEKDWNDIADSFVKTVSYNVICKNEILDLFYQLMPVPEYNTVIQIIQSLKYHGDLYIKEDSLFVELCGFIIRSLKQDHGKESINDLEAWANCSNAFSRCWPCLSMTGLTDKQKNEIYLEQICIAARYMQEYPDSFFLKGAYTKIIYSINQIKLEYDGNE